MAQQRSAALIVACLLASQPQLAELERVGVADQALDAAGPSGMPHCKALFNDWAQQGGIPQPVGEALSTSGVSCLSPCTTWCEKMLGVFAAFRDVAASFDISSLGLLMDASWADTCSLGLNNRQKCLVKVPAANLAAINGEVSARQGESRDQNKLVRELATDKNAIVQWGFLVRKDSYVNPTDPQSLFACKCSSCAASLASFYMRESPWNIDAAARFGSLKCRKASKGYDVECKSFLSECSCSQCFGGTNEQDKNIAGEGSFLLGGAGNRYLPETASAMRGFLQKYVMDGVCRGSCDYDRRMFKGLQ